MIPVVKPLACTDSQEVGFWQIGPIGNDNAHVSTDLAGVSPVGANHLDEKWAFRISASSRLPPYGFRESASGSEQIVGKRKSAKRAFRVLALV